MTRRREPGRHGSSRSQRPGRSPQAPVAPVFDAAEEPDLVEGGRRTRARARVERLRPGPQAGLMVDPRIAARRARVEADAGTAPVRHRRRWALVLVVVVLLAAGAALAALSPLASVRRVEVVGAQRTASAAVRAASGLEERPPLLRVDTREVIARVQGLAWVRRATVERRWPSTVVLTVEERQPAAVAPCDAGAAAGCLVDGSGRVLAPASQDPRVAAGLPRLEGVPAAGEPGTMLPASASGALAVAVNLPSALRPLVLGVRGDGPDVVLDLRAPGRDASPPVVRLGPPDRIQDKLTAAATVLARTSVNGLAVLDVRVPESPALTRVKR